MDKKRKEEITLLATLLDYVWDEDKGIWITPTGWTNHFNPFETISDSEKLKKKLRQDGWLITLQDKLDYQGGYISSGKVVHKDFTRSQYTETINERYTICYLALNAYELK